MLNNWQSSPYIIILYYKPYSCGKFVSNILSFNKNFVAQIPFTPGVKRYHRMIEKLHYDFDEQVLDEYKIKQIFLTIPPTKDECKNWYEYELGCSMFWGFCSGDLNFDKLYPLAIEMLKHKKYCFIVAHNHNDWKKMIHAFPNAKTIEIINDNRIRQFSMKLKTGEWSSNFNNRTVENSFKFNIDAVFNKEQFFQQIDNLLRCFELENSSLDMRVNDYYQQYVNLYE
jgi:hypothetical protein